MNTTYTWYSTLIKPTWAPPSWIFGPVWSVLYIIIAITFITIFYKTIKGELSQYVALPFALNIFFNLIFTPIQFGLQNNFLAAIDIVLVVATLVWGMKVLWGASKNLRWIVYANIPYLLWCLFASSLQLTITFLNW